MMGQAGDRRKMHVAHRESRARLILFLSLTICALAWTGALTIRQVTQTFSPSIAAKISPSNAPANDGLAEFLLAQNGFKADPDDLMAYAKRSIQSQGLNGPALRNAGLSMVIAHRPDAARRYFLLAEKTGRRDAMVDLALFEDAIRRGNIARGLALLDRALRVNENVQEVVFPALTKVLANREVANQIAPTLARADWTGDYAAFATSHSAATPVLGQVVTDHPEVAAGLDPARQRTLVRKLVQMGRAGLAVSTYESLTGQRTATTQVAEPFIIKDGWPPIDWEIATGGQITIGPAAEGGISFTITRGGEHVIARRLLRLAPGPYRILAKTPEPPKSLQDVGLRIDLKCANTSTELTALKLGDGSPDAADKSFSVPEGCPLQWAEVRGRAGREMKSGALAALKITER
ncbi:hypothetical protein GCM10011515_23600 [Tsuneonella deserti]|uniref:Tetratricopeptide repeat protein n=1 Tax=Tsuneonella deserti TaxID=2035528 RepID=A0ABQ1SDD5_9SPHN|nr:hypothetical protein [Tsuneonella deserti]GGE03257.1 hypothetical protein GCM10011515_23600 [Tsuneonella deserti]